jgi:hypothetical protein
MSWLCPQAEARATGTKGTGVFATAAIPAGTTVAAYAGYLIDREELRALDDDQRAHALQIDDELFLVSGPPYEPADFVNHSCDPNCGVVGSVLLVTIREVAAGEELCFDYAMTDSDPYDEFECRCGATVCRSVVRGDDWTRPELQVRYAGWFSSYLARRIEAVGRH